MELVIPFVKIQAVNPNLSNSKMNDASTIYYKCILVSFMSFRKFNPELKLVLATNVLPPNKYFLELQQLDVEIRLIHYSYNPPKEFGDRFRACFYIFDVIKQSKKSALYIDPDVICISTLNEFDKKMGNAIGIFTLEFPSHYNINGISPEQAFQIWKRYLKQQKYRSKITRKPHIGGEAIYIPGDVTQEISEKIATFWDWNTKQSINNSPFLTTEEHVLTQVFGTYKTITLNKYLSRIWTAKTYSVQQGNNVPLDELLMWHLPSEKSRGFNTAYRDFSGAQNIFRKQGFDYLKAIKRMFHIDYLPYRYLTYIKSTLKNSLNGNKL